MAALWRASWQGAIALAVAWFLTRLKFLPPSLRCWVWRLAYLKLLLVLVWNTPVELSLLRAAVPEIEGPAITSPATAESGIVAVAPEDAFPTYDISYLKSERRTAPPAGSSSGSWPVLLALLWLVGVLVLGGVWGFVGGGCSLILEQRLDGFRHDRVQSRA